MKQWNWKYFVLLLFAIPIVNQLAGYLGRSAADQVNQREAAVRKNQASKEIKVLVSNQDAQGVTQNDLTPEFLKTMVSVRV